MLAETCRMARIGPQQTNVRGPKQTIWEPRESYALERGPWGFGSHHQNYGYFAKKNKNKKKKVVGGEGEGEVNIRGPKETVLRVLPFRARSLGL